MDELLSNKDKIFSIIDFYNFNLYKSKIKFLSNEKFTFDMYREAIIKFNITAKNKSILGKIIENTDELHKDNIEKFLNFNCIYYYGGRGSGKTMFTKNSANNKDVKAFFLKSFNYEKIKKLEEKNVFNNLKYVIFDGLNEFDFSLKDILENIIKDLLKNNIKVIITGVQKNEIKQLNIKIGKCKFQNSLETNYMHRVSTLINTKNFDKYYKIIQIISFKLLSLREINYFINSLILLSQKEFKIKSNKNQFIYIWRNILEKFFEFYFKGERSINWKSHWEFLKRNIIHFYYGINVTSYFFKENIELITFFNSRNIVSNENGTFILKDKMLYLPIMLTYMLRNKNNQSIINDLNLRKWYTAFVLVLKLEKKEELNIEIIIKDLNDSLLLKNINNSILNKIMILYSFNEKRKKIVLDNRSNNISFFNFLISNFKIDNLNNFVKLRKEDYEKNIAFLIDNNNYLNYKNIMNNFFDLTDFNDRNMDIFYINYFTTYILSISEYEAIQFYKKIFKVFFCYKSFIKWVNIFLRLKIFDINNTHINILKYYLKKTFFKFKNTFTYKYIFYSFYFLNLHLKKTAVDVRFGDINNEDYLININNSLVQNAYVFLCTFFNETEYHTCKEIKEIMNFLNNKFLLKKNLWIYSYNKLHYTTSTKRYDNFDWKVIELIDFIILKFYKKEKYELAKYEKEYSNKYFENNLKINWPLINNNFFLSSNLNFCNEKIPYEKMWDIKFYPYNKEKFKTITNKFILFLIKNKFYAFKNNLNRESGFKIYYIFKEIKFKKEFNNKSVSEIVGEEYYINNFEIAYIPENEFLFQVQLNSETIFSSETINHQEIGPNYNGQIYESFLINPYSQKRINWSTKTNTIFFVDNSQTWFKSTNKELDKHKLKYYVCYCEAWNFGNVVRRWVILKIDNNKIFFQESFDTDEMGEEKFEINENKWRILK